MPRGKCRYFVALMLVLTAIAQPVQAGTDEQLQTFGKELQTTTKPAATKPELLIVPIPLSNPAIGTGITLTGALFYNPNQAPQPWITGVGITYTSNKSKAAGIAHVMSLDHDRFRIAALAGYADLNLKFYGIGPNAGNRDAYIKIEDKGLAALIQGQMRIASHLYFGGRYEFLNLKTTITLPNTRFPDIDIPNPQLKSTLSGIGPLLTIDSRDSSTNPRKGVFSTLVWLFNSPGLGSDFSYNKAQFAFNFYQPLGPTTNLAGRATLCAAAKGAPFYDLCLYGQMGDLRGYESGRYRDRSTWATQLELRQHLFWKIGAVAFAGVGGVAPSIGDLNDSKVLPSGGIGLRFLAAKRSNVNLRLDYAVGKGSHALYFGIGEAF